MNTKKMTAFIVGAMLIATVRVMAVSAAGMDRKDYADMPRMVYEFDAATDTGIYINDMGQNETMLRIYGETDAIYPTYTEADDFVYPDPVGAFDPGVIGEDSVTFNPAYMDDAATIDGGTTGEDAQPVSGEVVTSAPSVTPAKTSTKKLAENPETKGLLPGFEAVFVIAGLLAVAYLIRRR
jgi:PGF-CTERM protein